MTVTEKLEQKSAGFLTTCYSEGACISKFGGTFNKLGEKVGKIETNSQICHSHANVGEKTQLHCRSETKTEVSLIIEGQTPVYPKSLNWTEVSERFFYWQTGIASILFPTRGETFNTSMDEIFIFHLPLPFLWGLFHTKCKWPVKTLPRLLQTINMVFQL